jgi:hypothetical protein
MAEVAVRVMGSSSAGAHLLAVALTRLPLQFPALSKPPGDLPVAARLRSRRFALLCEAQDWPAAHALALSEPPTAAQLDHVRVFVQHVVAARAAEWLQGCTWPGVQYKDGAETVAEAALDEISKRCASRSAAPDLTLCEVAFRMRMAAGQPRAAADTALEFLALVKWHASLEAGDTSNVLRVAIGAAAMAAAALVCSDGADAAAVEIRGALCPATGWPNSGAAAESAGAPVAATRVAVEGELVRLQCLERLAATDAARAIATPAGGVFQKLLEVRAWSDAAELTQAAAPTAATFASALEALAAEVAASCAVALDEGLEDVDSGALRVWEGRWPELRAVLEVWESQEWLKGVGNAAVVAGGRLSPPGRLRLAAAKVRFFPKPCLFDDGKVCIVQQVDLNH